MNLFDSWQFYTIAFILLSILFNQFYKIVSVKAKNAGVASATFQIIAGIVVLFFIPFYKFVLPSNPLFYFLILLSSLFYTIHNRLQTSTRKHLDVSVVVILSGVSVVALFVLGIIFYGEPILFTKVLGCILILFANAYVFYKKGEFHFNKNSFLNIFAWLCYSTAITIDVANSKNFNVAFYITILFFLPALMISVFDRVSLEDIMNELKSKHSKYYFLTSIPLGLLVIANLRALQLGEFTTVSPLEATAIFLNVIVAYILFNEREDLLKKIIAALLIIAGVYLTVVQ